MGLASVSAIAVSALKVQGNNLSATASNIANANTPGYRPQGEAPSDDDGVDLAAEMMNLTEEELAYRANAAVLETGADLWDILSLVPRDSDAA